MSFAPVGPAAYDANAPRQQKGDPVVLVSFVLVLAAAVTLVVGLVAGDGLGLIYVSIACSLSAGIVLAVAVLRSRPQVELAGAGSVPLGEGEGFFAPSPLSGFPGLGEEVPAQPAAVGVGQSAGEGGEWDVDAHWSERSEEAEAQAPAPAEPEPGELIFPIADYDELRVGEIVPLLPELDPDELEMVRERELAGKARATILSRIDALLGVTPPAPAGAARPTAAGKAAAKKAAAPAKKVAAAKRAAAEKAAATKEKAVPAGKRAAAKKAATPARSTARKAAAAAAAAKKAPAARKAGPAGRTSRGR